MENERNIAQWQSRLLPLMIRMIVILAFFFFIASLVQLIYLHKRIEQTPQVNITQLSDPKFEKSTIALELLLIEKRYHQANTSLMSRIWLKYLGFVTGMILTFIGATFVLGKLRESPTNLSLSAKDVTLSIVSSSPGIILALLGALIMLITIFKHNKIDVYDNNVYLPSSIITEEAYNPLEGIGKQPDVKDSTLARPKAIEETTNPLKDFEKQPTVKDTCLERPKID